MIVPAVQMTRLREIGVATQHDLLEAGFVAQRNGSVDFRGRAFV